MEREFPGECLTRVLVANKPALPFWRRAVRDYMQGEFEERDLVALSGMIARRPYALFLRFPFGSA